MIKSFPAIRRVIAVTMAMSVLLATGAHAQVDELKGPNYGNALPEARTAFNQRFSYAQPQGGEVISFKSSSEGTPDLDIKGVLFKPSGPASGAVVIVNGGDGWSDVREGHYARSISSAGYVVLAIDTYGPRGVKSTSTDNSAISIYDQTLDVFAAKRYLVSLGYSADRIAVMGVDRGGTIALLVADKVFAHGEKIPFTAAIAVGGICIFHPREPQPNARMFLAIGAKDQVTGVKPCQDLAKEYSAASGKSTVKIYSGVTSRFDGDPAYNIMSRYTRDETFADCDVVVESDGRFVYQGRTFAATDSHSLFSEMHKSCVGIGASGYTNVTQKATVTLDIIDFLDASLR